MIRAKYKILIVLLAIALTVIAVCAAWITPYFYDSAGVKVMVYIRPETSLSALNDTLEAYCGKGFASRTIRVLSWLDVDLSLRSGCYMITAADNPVSGARKIRNYEQTPVRFTFNNLRLKEQFAQKASQRLMLHEDELMSLLNDSASCSVYDKSLETITNILLPDSYEVYWNISPEDLLGKMNDYYIKFWTEDRVNKAKALGLSPDEVQVLASIVEEETAQADEYGKVARLYINRLERGMKLQADPTVKYAIGDFSIRRITNAMLETPSPYNTYINPGLPPGPIRLASKRTINAVLDAPQHDYLYMCAREDFSGYHNFAVSYSQHLVNARKYQAELNRRGIR